MKDNVTHIPLTRRRDDSVPAVDQPRRSSPAFESVHGTGPRKHVLLPDLKLADSAWGLPAWAGSKNPSLTLARAKVEASIRKEAREAEVRQRRLELVNVRDTAFEKGAILGIKRGLLYGFGLGFLAGGGVIALVLKFGIYLVRHT